MNTQTLNNQKDGNVIRDSKFLIWIGFILYILITGGKNIYTAEIVTLIDVFNATKAEITLASTYYFVTYAIAQVVMVFIISKLNLRYFVSISAILTAIAIILIGSSTSLNAIYVISGLNGIFTVGIFVGIMAILSKTVPASLLPYSNKVMSIGGSLYNVLAYGLPALFVDFGLWRVPFLIAGGLSLIFGVLFFIALTKMKKYSVEKVAVVEKKDSPVFILKNKKIVVLYYILFMVLAIFSNATYYCIFIYFPNLLKEVFNMPDSYSILITLIVPLISSISAVVSISICSKRKNLFSVGALFGVLALVFITLLAFLYDVNIILTLVLAVVGLALRNGAHATFGSVLAFNMRNQVNTGSYLAGINAIASLCAGIIPPLLGNLMDSFSGTKGFGACYFIAIITLAITIIFLFVLALFLNKNQKLNALNDK